MESRFALLILISSLILFSTFAAKNADLYKVLGVNRKATQREIQKAFHKLSLKYHPDKNKNKGAQEKFSEINNAYDILSDEQKRKNYDMFGDEKGQPGFEAGPRGDQGGYTFFTGGGQRQNRYNMGQSRNFQNMGGGMGGSKTYSFSFGGSESSGGFDSFDFGLGDVFSNLFGGSPHNGGRFGGSQSGSNFKSGFQSGSKSIRSLNSQIYQTEVIDKGMTWLFLSRSSSMKGVQNVESIAEAVAQSLKGALKVGSVNCEMERSLCKELGISSSRTPKVFVYSYQASGKASLVEYGGDWSVKDLISFCHKHMPRLSKRVQLNRVDFSSLIDEKLATVMFISAKRDSPVVWQVLSGLYHKRFHFYDAQVPDASDPRVQELGVHSLPVVVGWLSNGEKHILKKGSSLDDLKSAVHELSSVLDSFEKMNKKVASRRATKQQTDDSSETKIPLLSASNFVDVCGENIPVCIIGAFRSSGSKNKLRSILEMVSQKTLSRRPSPAVGAKDSVSYCLLDARNQAAFLTALENSSDKSLDAFLVAYKPRKNKFAVFRGDTTVEEVEGFVGSVLSGDVRFTRARRKPVIS